MSTPNEIPKPAQQGQPTGTLSAKIIKKGGPPAA